MIHPAPAHARSWKAELLLGFAVEGARTTLRKQRSGPLLVQQALYPEGPEICHAVVLHPPGGIAGGDSLHLDLDLAGGSRALVTSPGATRWYRTAGEEAAQRVSIRAHDATIEWLPQETIVYDAAMARAELTIELFGSSLFLGCEILCLGRTASGERFRRGCYRQHVRIFRDGRLIWSERTRLEGSDALLGSPVGMASRVVSATLVLAGVTSDAEILAACRAVTPAEPGARAGVTAHREILIGRYLGDSGEHARRYLVELWRLLRPRYLGCAAVLPRIWNT